MGCPPRNRGVRLEQRLLRVFQSPGAELLMGVKPLKALLPGSSLPLGMARQRAGSCWPRRGLPLAARPPQTPHSGLLSVSVWCKPASGLKAHHAWLSLWPGVLHSRWLPRCPSTPAGPAEWRPEVCKRRETGFVWVDHGFVWEKGLLDNNKARQAAVQAPTLVGGFQPPKGPTASEQAMPGWARKARQGVGRGQGSGGSQWR